MEMIHQARFCCDDKRKNTTPFQMEQDNRQAAMNENKSKLGKQRTKL